MPVQTPGRKPFCLRVRAAKSHELLLTILFESQQSGEVAFKNKLKQWYLSQFQKQLNDEKNVYEVNVEEKLSIIKSIHAGYIISLYEKFCNSNEMITKAFQVFSITEVLK